MIIFWIFYIISGLCVYTILFCTYKRQHISYNNYGETDERIKHSLWFILALIAIFLTPGLNSIIPLIMGVAYYMDDERKYYYKSFLTKKY